MCASAWACDAILTQASGSGRMLQHVCSCTWLCAFALLHARDIIGQCEMVAPPPM